jgi:asparagine synthase (glutamine-hydrolysing)
VLPKVIKDALDPRRGPISMDFLPAHPNLTEKYNLTESSRERLQGLPESLRQERADFFERFDSGPIQAAARAVSGVDFRDPTGDKRVFEFCYAIPVEQYIVGGHSRSLVRRAMKGRLPEATLNRYARGQQGVDWHLTVGESLPALAAEQEKLESSAAAQHFVDMPRMRRLLATWPESGYETNDVISSWNYALTRGITTGMFLRKYEQGETPLQSAGSAPRA